jgi:hypothetical protein
MLRGGADLELKQGQEVVLAAVGSAYKTWEGYCDEATGGALVAAAALLLPLASACLGCICILAASASLLSFLAAAHCCYRCG